MDTDKATEGQTLEIKLDDSQGAAKASEASAQEPDLKAEFAKFKEERVAEKAAFEEREKQLMARLEAAEKRPAAPTPATPDQPRTRKPEEWEQLFQEKGFVGAMGAYENEITRPILLGIIQANRDENNETLKIVANNQREALKRNDLYSGDRAKKVDVLLSSLTPKERAQPGVYAEALKQISDVEDLAEVRMRGLRRSGVLVDRGPEYDREGEDTSGFTRAEERHAKMFGIKSKKEWAELQNGRVFEV